MNKAKEEFKEILSKLERSNIPFSQLNKSTVIKNFKFNHHKLVLQPLMFGCVFLLPYFLMMNLNFSENCIIDMPDAIRKILRQPEYCEICVDVYKVDKISSISPTEFLENYVKKVHPVVVTDGAVNWSARSIFNFKFFKEYFHKFEIKKHSDKNCQFFPYHTEFRSLREAFNVSESRALSNEKEKPWYIGWNNCNDEAGRYLRQFYERPYFLSNLTESLALSWIFMGGPGPGAHMHVDNVHYPSWQAQLRGRKLWKLAPPPECHYYCNNLEIIVEPGEIIVLETNRWYHQTIILPGDISITIGSEFD